MMRVHICDFTDFSDLRLIAEDKEYRFSFSKMFGPKMIGKSGHEIEWLPGVYKHEAFWDALQWWCQQGHRVVDGVCVYDEQPAELWWSPDGKNFVMDTPENRAKFAAFVTDRQCTMQLRNGRPIKRAQREKAA